MFKQLFFDDQRLFVRENLERAYGVPVMKLEADRFRKFGRLPTSQGF